MKNCKGREKSGAEVGLQISEVMDLNGGPPIYVPIERNRHSIISVVNSEDELTQSSSSMAEIKGVVGEKSIFEAGEEQDGLLVGVPGVRETKQRRGETALKDPKNPPSTTTFKLQISASSSSSSPLFPSLVPPVKSKV
ncbi:hypothetical protein NE237_004518 [Protea cynaroides]|uniref:Uncharacterized protein n=1 Tax=Protea cynaroides TaxID=273540 RepID=A0A9Q0KJ23_9MAGN|nr:hypothetical protein NE237_004518 [Protea cynaroides]